jgi:hypothetical protein
MKALLIFLPILLVILSGCVTPISGNGVEILTFEPSFPTVYSGESVDFRIKIQNHGTVDAIDVTPRIIGLETWDAEGGTCDDWDRIPAAVPEIGAPGGSANCRWTFTAPEVPTGLSTEHSPIARLYYGYRTSVVKSVLLASSKELRLMNDRGDTIPVQTASQTSGPLQIDVKTEAPVRFWESHVTFPISITVNNVGGGVVCRSVNRCESDDELNMLSLEIEAGNDISISDDCETDIELWQGKTNTLVCQATFTGLSDIGIVQRTLSINTNYGYYTDKTASVTITSR